MAVAPGVTREHRYGGDVLVLRSAGASEAVVAVKGAQVLSFRPDGQREVLWLQPEVSLQAEPPVRGGIPICWPWFGPAAVAGGPAHGFARNVLWTVTGCGVTDGAVHAALALEASAAPAPLWPFRCRVTLTVTLTDRLHVALATHNTGDQTVEITEALHSYLAIGDIASIAISGLEGRSYIDQLADGRIGREANAIAFAGEIDRIYAHDSGAVTISDTLLRRHIVITKSGSASTVLWNPWIDKAARLGDLGPDGWRRMVCVETANAAKHKVALGPAEHHCIETTLAVKPEAGETR